MKLGDLEFKAQDFQFHTRYKAVFVADEGTPKALLDENQIVEVANRILREKLDKISRIYTNANEPRPFEQALIWSEGKLPTHTHSARLVCIEEVNK